jgi:hypothetical protein
MSMHGLRRIILLALILGGLFSFVGLRSPTETAHADTVANFTCDTGNTSFQVCTIVLNAPIGPGGSFTVGLVLGGQIVNCVSIPAGIACSRTTTQATFLCAGGCANGSRFQVVISGPQGAASQLAFSIAPGGGFVAAPAYTTGSGGYAPNVSQCYGLVLVGCAAYNSFSYSSCGLFFAYSCYSPFVNGCVTSLTNVPTCGGSCFWLSSCGCAGFTLAFCPSNCTFGLLCNTTNNVSCLAIGASCSNRSRCNHSWSGSWNWSGSNWTC